MCDDEVCRSSFDGVCFLRNWAISSARASLQSGELV